MSVYTSITPIDIPIPAERQRAKRHYGVHPYFTRRPFNVVRDYILRYSVEGDTVLDPFGGSGVTAIEAFLENRTGIQNDINPLANFIAGGIANLARGDLNNYRDALEALGHECKSLLARIEGMDQAELNALLGRLPLPPNIPLPSNSDVSHYHDLFSPKQLASLAVLKSAIEGLPDGAARNAMRLAWSASLAKLNLTFLSAEGRAESRGGSSIFSIYRYKVAKNPVELPAWSTFNERAGNVLAAKSEVDQAIYLKQTTGGWHGKFRMYAEDVQELSKKFRGKIDYIFTDPPYGAHISYLDLSVLWNCWLGHMPSRKTARAELIVGGELDLQESVYVARLGRSIQSCLAMLKPGRWLSVVFQHWNVAYFEAILSSAVEAGAELRAAISQIGDPIWSMHKKKSSESVLAGEMILTFSKTGRLKSRRVKNGFDISEALEGVLAECRSDAVFGEYLFNRMVIAAWQNGSISSLNIARTDFIDLLRQKGWQYQERTHMWIKGEERMAPLFEDSEVR